MSEGMLVIVRHGESVANKTVTYAGWLDSDLTERGIHDAERCAGYLKDAGICFDACFCSVLKRAIRTMWTITDVLDQMWVPTYSTWRLNECHCGQFTAMKQAVIKKQFKDDSFRRWRVDYKCPPPLLDRNDERAPAFDRRYSGVRPEELPLGESLEMAWRRLEPFWNREIMRRVKAGQKVLVVSHGNLIRAMRVHVERMNPLVLNKMKVIANGYPLVYRFNNGILKSKEILGSKAQRKVDASKSQVI